MTRIFPLDKPVYVPSEADLERQARVKRLNRRKAAKIRKLKKFYMKQVQAKTNALKKKMRSAPWSEGHAL